MTRASHYDILRYRTEEELRARYGARYRQRISGTQKNEMRRQQGVGLPWHGTERLGERKDVEEEKDLNEKKTIGMGMMTKEDEANTFGSPPPYSEKL
ncbi:hypothetical protein CPB84DRAFT_1768576 [Gymnopilus junonius]|uniref:Uncharacterized protein n=1 Tax=Gymnopilus junonius TaxID=109634 RepID=A0A9P5NXD1_GYMJU|nr:hypothetical protein CPB84DRAFT_1768576 [Gymnopilus junonius]